MAQNHWYPNLKASPFPAVTPQSLPPLRLRIWVASSFPYQHHPGYYLPPSHHNPTPPLPHCPHCFYPCPQSWHLQYWLLQHSPSGASGVQKLQLVHNSAAQIIDTPILHHLHWLPVSLVTFSLFSCMRSRTFGRFSSFSFTICWFKPSLFYVFVVKPLWVLWRVLINKIYYNCY